MSAPKVYAAIAAVQAELAKIGIAKNRQSTQPGAQFRFRGIDDVYDALAPLMPQKGLVVIPRLTERTVAERTSGQGKALFYTTVKADFDFVSVEDGTSHTASSYGEAMDSGDKSTAKAMSAAFKAAAFMTFTIPVEGTPDADDDIHEVEVKVEEPPHGWGDWARALIDDVGKAPDNEAIDALRDENKRFINGCRHAEEIIFKSVMDAFMKRRQIVKPNEAF